MVIGSIVNTFPKLIFAFIFFVRYNKNMYRSFLLVIAFVFFSVAMPCLCVGGGMSFVVAGSDSCSLLASPHEYSSYGAECMNVFDHAASWREFLSSPLPTLFTLLSALLLIVFSSRFRYALALRVFEFRRGIFRPPEYFDERVLLSSPLFRALFSGVLHAKVA